MRSQDVMKRSKLTEDIFQPKRMNLRDNNTMEGRIYKFAEGNQRVVSLLNDLYRYLKDETRILDSQIKFIDLHAERKKIAVIVSYKKDFVFNEKGVINSVVNNIAKNHNFKVKVEGPYRSTARSNYALSLTFKQLDTPKEAEINKQKRIQSLIKSLERLTNLKVSLT